MNAHTFESAELIENGRAVALYSSDGRRVRFHATWLRDNAMEPGTRAAGSSQHLITMRDLAPGLTISSVEFCGDDQVEFTFLPGKLRTRFCARWLNEHTYDHRVSQAAGWVPPHILMWDSLTFPGMSIGASEQTLPTIDFAAARDDRGALGDWLAGVRRYGVALMRAGPIEGGAVLKVAELFSFVRETNYGRCFDVRADVNPSNLAYTSLELQAHTDNPYRDPAPTMQLSCTASTTPARAVIPAWLMGLEQPPRCATNLPGISSCCQNTVPDSSMRAPRTFPCVRESQSSSLRLTASSSPSASTIARWRPLWMCLTKTCRHTMRRAAVSAASLTTRQWRCHLACNQENASSLTTAACCTRAKPTRGPGTAGCRDVIRIATACCPFSLLLSEIVRSER